MAAAPQIKTTVVGSYPVPDWLAAAPSEQAVVDATRVVLHTQEQAGIDVVCDGELYRFDVNHPDGLPVLREPVSGPLLWTHHCPIGTPPHPPA
jgi:hypothetical protein